MSFRLHIQTIENREDDRYVWGVPGNGANKVFISEFTSFRKNEDSALYIYYRVESGYAGRIGEISSGLSYS